MQPEESSNPGRFNASNSPRKRARCTSSSVAQPRQRVLPAIRLSQDGRNEVVEGVTHAIEHRDLCNDFSAAAAPRPPELVGEVFDGREGGGSPWRWLVDRRAAVDGREPDVRGVMSDQVCGVKLEHQMR